jgi:hypothetical protein
VGAAAVVVLLAPVGIRYLVLLGADAALLVLASWQWWAWHRRRRDRRRPAPPLEQLWYPATIAVVVGGAAAGAARWPVGRTVDGWGDVRFVVLALVVVATAVTLAGTFWMRPAYTALAGSLTLGAYLGTLGAFEPEGSPWPGWVAEVSWLAALATGLGLTALASLDHGRRRQAMGRGRGPGLVPVAVGLGATAAWVLVTRQQLGWPLGGWGTLAIATAAYALTVLVTYAEVMPGPAGPAERGRETGQPAAVGSVDQTGT